MQETKHQGYNKHAHSINRALRTTSLADGDMIKELPDSDTHFLFQTRFFPKQPGWISSASTHPLRFAPSPSATAAVISHNARSSRLRKCLALMKTGWGTFKRQTVSLLMSRFAAFRSATGAHLGGALVLKGVDLSAGNQIIAFDGDDRASC
jgi:hypothetical protein